MLSVLSALSLLPVLGHGHVLEQREVLGSMTLHNYARYCQNDGSSCMYTFGIEEDPNICQFSPCIFTVDAKDGKLANQTDFQLASCSNMRYNYRINGGWDSTGYLTLVVTNLDLDTKAYISYQDAEMQNGLVVGLRTQPSYRASRDVHDFKDVLRREWNEPEDDSEWWQIQGMLRTWDTTFGVVDLTFNIILSSGASHQCEILLRAPDHPEKIGSWSFYDQPCNRGDFSVSWGYNDTEDFAVMTLCSPDRSKRAFFGYNHVSNTQRLGDTSKSPVQITDC